MEDRDQKFQLVAQDVVYFTSSVKNPGEGQLSEFLSFLKFFGIRPPIMFNYLSPSGGLIPNLNLRSNIILDSVATICREDRIELEKILAEHSNPFLKLLLNNIENIDGKSREVSPRDRKLAAIIKTFVKKMPFVFLEYPEKHLLLEDMEIFKNLLAQASLMGPSIYLLLTHEAHYFSELITKQACRTPEDRSFIVENLPRQKTVPGLRFLGVSNNN